MRNKRSWLVAVGVAGAVGAAAVALGVANATVPSRLTLWSTQFGTNVEDVGAAVATSPNGTICVYGQTKGDLVGSTPTDTDVFLACYDKYGNRKWIRQFGTPGTETPGNQIAIASNGDVYVTGTTDDAFPAQFPEGGEDVFVAKFNQSGSLRWVKQFGGQGNDEGWGIARSPGGDLYVSVETQSNDFPSGSLPTNTYSGNMDSALVRLDRNGDLKWAEQFGSPENDWAWGVHVSKKGEIYLAGTTFGDLDGAGSEVFHGSDHAKGDGFIARFDAAGARLWLHQLGSDENDQMYGVATDLLGDVYLAGFTYGSLGTNAGFSGNLAGSDGVSADGVVYKFNKAGVLKWINQHGTSGNDFEWNISVSKKNKVFLGGYTDGALSGYTNLGGNDSYVLRLNPDGVGEAHRQFGTAGAEAAALHVDSVFGTPVVVAPNGTVVLTGTTDGAIWGQSNAGLTDVFLTVIPAP